MTTTGHTIENTRRAYRFLLAYAGETPDGFAFHCRALIEEQRDGEGEGEPTPAEWLHAALERAWDVTTKFGRDKGGIHRFEKCKANVDALLSWKL